MKKLMLMCAVVLVSVGLAAKELPENVVKYLASGFPEREVLIYDIKVNYELTLDDYTVVVFTPKGEWKEVDAEKMGEIPDTAVPEKILKVVKKQWPEARIVKMEHKIYTNGKYEVELDNDIEVEFNSDFQLVGINK